MLSDDSKIDLLVFKSYLDEGYSVTIAKLKTFGRTKKSNLERINRMVYSQEYVDVLNDYMKRVRRPIEYRLTLHGIEAVKRYICSICEKKKSPEQFSHKNANTCRKCDTKRSNDKRKELQLSQRAELDRKQKEMEVSN